ncbi:MAG: cell division protein FtsZ, partial [Gemmatimonadota bacterium]
LLDNVSINGATGVLVNISGGPDLTIDEVTTINSIVQEAAGDEAEMIFGAVQDEALEGRVRVTVIATGFGEPVEDERPEDGGADRVSRDAASRIGNGNGRRSRNGASEKGDRERDDAGKVIRADFEGPRLVKEDDDADTDAGGSDDSTPARDEPDPPSRTAPREEPDDLEIPTFIRRQMD